MTQYIGKKGALRLYDSTGTPYYVEFVYEEMDFSGPMGRARPDEVARMHRNNLDANFHYVQGSDEKIVEPVEISFSFKLDDTKLRTLAREALDVDSTGSSWTVGGDTWVTTKGDTQLVSGVSAASVTLPAFADGQKNCSNLEILWDEGSNDIGLKYAEVYFPPEQTEISESEDGLTISVTGLVHGPITQITGFTAGTQSST